MPTFLQSMSTTNGPAGAIAPTTVYQFDGTASALDDRTANGMDLTLKDVSPLGPYVTEGSLTGLQFNTTARLGAANSNLTRISGAITWEVLLRHDSLSGVQQIIAQEAGGDLSPDNYLWSTRASGSSLSVFTEYGAGINQERNVPAFSFDLVTTYHVVVTRASNGLDYRVFVNGVKVDTFSFGNVPSDGSATSLLIGESDNPSFPNAWFGVLFGARVTAEEWSDAQVIEAYNNLLTETVPELQNQSPAPLSTGNASDTLVSFEVVDTNYEIDLSTVQVYINGTLAWENDAPVQPGFTGNRTPITDGYMFNLYSWDYFTAGTQTIQVIAQNVNTNTMDESYTFDTDAGVEELCGRAQWGVTQWGATQWGEILDCDAIEAEDEDAEEFPFSTYRFILESVRKMDQRSPGLLQPILEEGLDPIWETFLYDRLTSLRDTIYDPTAIDDKWLPWLKALVGFTQDLNFEATEDELRRIIANALPYWNEKPTEQAITLAIRLVVSENRFRIRNWFDFRFESDKTHVTAQLQDFDPNAIDFGIDHISGSYATTSALTGYPWDRVIEFDAQDTNLVAFQSPTQYEYLLLEDFVSPYDSLNGIYRIAECVVGQRYVILTEDLPIKAAGNFGTWRLAGGLGDWTTEVRIVDEPGGTGQLNRDLIKFLMEQVRNHGERIDLVYVDFLDEFLIEEELSQWQVSSETDVQVLAPGGELSIAAGAIAISNTGFENMWFDQSVSYRCQGAATAVMSLIFWRVNTANFFHVEVDFDNSTLKLYRTVSSAPTQIGSTVTVPYVITADQDASIRVDALAELTGARIRVKLSGETLIDEYITPPTTQYGGVGVSAVNATCKLSLIEVMTVPATVDRVGPNP